MSEPGYAVLDLETTGLSAAGADRIIEIAIVHVSPTGEIEGRWETLINPGRDTGPTHIHGIYPADVRHAPTFADVLSQLFAQLQGRVFVAHNVSFDLRFLLAEAKRAGNPAPLRLRDALCTMLLSRDLLSIPSKTLAACCKATGIALDDAHRASADAMATAELLGAYLRLSPDRPMWAGSLATAAATSWPELPETSSVPLIAREDAALRVSFAHRIPLDSDVDAPTLTHATHSMYRTLLDRCLVSFDADPSDVDDVVAFAALTGLSRDACAALNLEHFHGLTAAAWANGTLTDADQRHLVAAARLLSLTHELTGALRPPAATAPGAPQLQPGDKVTLTGFSASDKRELGIIIEAAGAVPWPSLVKATKLLVAADTDSLSNKGRTARRLGIPIVDEAGLRALISA